MPSTHASRSLNAANTGRPCSSSLSCCNIAAPVRDARCRRAATQPAQLLEQLALELQLAREQLVGGRELIRERIAGRAAPRVLHRSFDLAEALEPSVRSFTLALDAARKQLSHRLHLGARRLPDRCSLVHCIARTRQALLELAGLTR